MNKVILVDMDGTLFDYEYSLRWHLKRIASPGDPDIASVDLWDEAKYPYLKPRMDLIKSIPGWWASLPRYDPGWEILKMAEDIGFVAQILTKGPVGKPHAWAEKVQCINEHFPDGIGINITTDNYGNDKSMNYGRVLVDDYPVYVENWLEHRCRGLAILPKHKYNEDFSHPNAIIYDKENAEEVRRALHAAFDRDPGVHWKDML